MGMKSFLLLKWQVTLKFSILVYWRQAYISYTNPVHFEPFAKLFPGRQHFILKAFLNLGYTRTFLSFPLPPASDLGNSSE